MLPQVGLCWEPRPVGSRTLLLFPGCQGDCAKPHSDCWLRTNPIGPLEPQDWLARLYQGLYKEVEREREPAKIHMVDINEAQEVENGGPVRSMDMDM